MPKLESGSIVLCDRFMDSTLAYQGYGRGLSRKLINEMNNFAVSNCIPGLTIIFDADPFLLSERNSNKNLDRMEVEGIEFQKQVRAGYLDIAKNNNRCHVVYCKNRSIEDIHLEVKSLIINNILKDKE